MRFASKIIGTPIYRLVDRKKIAYVSDLIIEPTTGKLFAFQVSGDKINKNNCLISPYDLFFYNPEGIIIETDLKLNSYEDFPKGYNLLKNGGKIKGMKVFKDKEYLGKVKEFALDETDTVKRLHLSRLFSVKSILEDTVISFEKIKKIQNNKIILN